jgi:hypothetical protein
MAVTRSSRVTTARLGTLALVVTIAALGASLFVARTAAAEVPAHWRPLLMAHPWDARPAAPQAAGSAADRADLDELVSLQAAAGTSHQTATSYWTSQPSPTRWNEILLNLFRQEKTNPVRASRALGLLNAAMYDAVIAACDAKIAFPRTQPHDRDARIASLAGPDDLSSYASADAAIAAAARTILSAVFPGDAETFLAAAQEVEQVRMWTGMNTRSDIAAGEAIGKAIGALAVKRAQTDNADAIFRGSVPSFSGSWVPARPFANTLPDEPMAGTWKPWLMTSGSEFRPPPPPVYTSPGWQKDADEVVSVQQNLTDAQFQIARFWADGGGTDTPPGHWVRIAIGLIVRDKVPTTRAARTLAYLAVAEAYAFISCWNTKYVYWTGRPNTLIPGFGSTIITPNFPSFTSGHATVSGAASTVLADFFPKDAGSLRAMAEEAALSRLYGGIHWRVDNEVGLHVGRQVGSLAVARLSADGL